METRQQAHYFAQHLPGGYVASSALLFAALSPPKIMSNDGGKKRDEVKAKYRSKVRAGGIVYQSRHARRRPLPEDLLETMMDETCCLAAAAVVTIVLVQRGGPSAKALPHS